MKKETKVKKEKTIKVDLLPEDFIDNYYVSNEDCPLARAIKRHFEVNEVTIYPDELSLTKTSCGYDTALLSNLIDFSIKNSFEYNDYEFVKEQYEKDPKAEKVIYYVELLPVK